MGQLIAVELIYRGVFQKTLAKNITRGIVLAAHNEGKLGISFGRYGDSPERNGIPAKSFAIVADDEQTLEAGMAQYEPKSVDVTVVLDDTLCKGTESWAWYGLRPVNGSLKPGRTLIVISQQDASALLKLIHRRQEPYKLGILKGVTSFSGMWNYKDDHTDVRVLGAIAKALPELVSMKSVEQFISEKLKSSEKVASARAAFDHLTAVDVKPGQGNSEKLKQPSLLKWQDMRLGVSIKGQPQGGPYEDPSTKKMGGFRPARNELFAKFSTRTVRPVINFATCTKCTLCWLNCPDGSFDVTPDGTYDVDLQSCCGCGICEAVCPVKNCISMVNEAEFHDSDRQWVSYKEDSAAYLKWLEKTIKKAEPLAERSQGFRYRGQYKEQIPVALEVARKG
ncbi:MAG TPA: 4Fe-4S dicluster-binding protein [Candidatus Eremiobacteraceae bacterium]|nr:4Fe-4S dicluster-binding protein [Candidatus Eremiobacteraceae bacterium]